MATNKDKLLESAQKNLKKKQVAKAIKDYAKIVEIDPADVRSRQKLAELYVRTNKNTEAYEHYEAVAKYFSSNGFYLKAIAIYKQMQRLDSSQISIYNRLAELNEKQGLLGNAMAEYRNLVDYFERNGMVADQIKTLEKMRDLDGDNLNIRIKLAEVYAKNERKDDGYEEFEGVLAVLNDKAQYDKILKLYKMFLPLYPDNKKMQMGLALAFYEKGDYTRGVTIIENLLKDKPNDPDLLRLLGRGYSDVKDWDNARLTFNKLLDLDPTDLDMREALINCEIGDQRYDTALDELEEWKDTFFQANRTSRLKEFYETLKDKKIENPAILETLDSIYELTGEGDKLLDIISEKVDVEEEPVVEELLSDSLLGSAEADISNTSIGLALEEDNVLEFDLVEDEGLDLQLESTQEIPADLGGEDSFIELEIDDDLDLSAGLDGGDDFAFDLTDDEDPVESAAINRDLKADLEEAEFYIQQGLYAEAEKLCRDIVAYAPDSKECRQKLEEIAALQQGGDTAAATEHVEQRSADLGMASAFAEADDLGGSETDASAVGNATAEDPFNVSFSDDDFDFNLDNLTTDSEVEKKIFKTDVDEQIEADDMESHYNLGIAYREMGLFDDAVSEFEKAEKEPARFVDCQTLKGLCYSDKGDYSSAERMFQQALDSHYLEDIQRLNLGYELGLLYERADRLSDALVSYQNVHSQDVNYRDVAEKIMRLKGTLGLDGDGDDSSDERPSERISFL